MRHTYSRCAWLLLPVPMAVLCARLLLAQEPARSIEPRHDPRRDYAAFLALPAEKQERIRFLVKDLGQEDPETQGRLLQVMQRYVTWLERLPAAERRHVESAPTSLERIGRIRELREKQWIATLGRADKERVDRALKNKDIHQACQITQWLAVRVTQSGIVPGVPVCPLPLLEERHRLLVGIKLREQRTELERQLALTQGPERQEAMGRELNRLRAAFKDKQLTREERQFVNQNPPEDVVAFVRGLVDLAKKYDVSLPELRRQPLLGQGLPPLGREKMAEFLRDFFSETVQKDYEERLKDPKKRTIAVAELSTLYWNTHPQELHEFRRLERDKKGKEIRPGKKF